MSILIIANPKSGRYNPKKLAEAQKILEKRFGEVSLTLTKHPGHATEIAKNAEHNIIIAAGGDGLINETAQGVAETDKLFSVLCFGSANVFCKEYGIPLNPIKAANHLQINKFRHIPIGYVDAYIFLTMVGFGFDTQVVKNVNKWRIINIYVLSELLHIIYGGVVLFKNQFRKFSIYVNRNKKDVYHSIVSLGEYYAGNFKLGNIKKSKLNVFLITKKGFLPLLKNIISIVLGFGFKGEKETTDYLKISGVSACQIDGQYVELNKASVFVRIKNNAIKLIS